MQECQGGSAEGLSKYIQYSGNHLAVQSVSVTTGLQRTVDKLTEEMYFMKMAMKDSIMRTKS